MIRAHLKYSIEETDKNLKIFWNRSTHYYRDARNANKQITEDRELMARSLLPDARVIDIASGSGENSRFIGNRIYFGIDISFLGLQMAKDYSNARLIHGDVYHLPVRDESFSNMICTHSIEHFLYVEGALGEMWRVLKTSGVLILLFPNFGDCFFRLPPSMKKKKILTKLNYVFRQFIRKFLLLVGLKKISFPVITDPDILEFEFESDNDLTYAASAQELRNYFTMKGASKTELNFYKPTFKSPFLENFKTNVGSIIRMIYYSIPLFKYQRCGILVVTK